MVAISLGLNASLALSRAASSNCRNIPGDPGWPTNSDWDNLNKTVGGRLSAPLPVGNVCHGASYDAAACAYVQEMFGLPDFMTPRPEEFMADWFSHLNNGSSCWPYSDVSSPCILGNYVPYAINVSSVEDVQAGLAFARDHNIRLVIKASGHDYYGRSTGQGALSLWTHNLVDNTFLPEYNSSYYSGPAAKIGAGTNGGAGGDFVAANGYRLVAGTCPSVTPAGGFTQGGGHSLLSGLYGYGADQVLEWEVVLADGQHVIATPEQNTDLYWALSGGGGGTYAVVISMTVRVYPDGLMSLATFSFNQTLAGGDDLYWKAIEVFHQSLQNLTDEQGMVADMVTNNETFYLVDLLAPGLNKTELRSAMDPMLTAITGATNGAVTPDNINLNISTSDSYNHLYTKVLRPELEKAKLGPVQGGRMISQDNFATNASTVTAAMREALLDGKFFLSARGLNYNGAGKTISPVADNSVQPAFKNVFITLIITAIWDNSNPWSDAIQLQDDLMNTVMPKLVNATPGSGGTYVNEGNWAQPDFQDNFYGSTYPRLLSLKSKFDPNGTFYGLTTVGSEYWEQDSDGRLCQVQN